MTRLVSQSKTGFFDQEDWNQLKNNWSAWWAHELDRPLVMIQTRDETVAVKDAGEAPSFVSNLPLDMPFDQVLERYESQILQTRFHGDLFPKWWPNFGPGIAAGFLGGQVHTAPDTVWFTPGDTFEDCPIEQMTLDDLPGNRWWTHIQALTRAACERWAGKVAVAFTDIGGNLDILASLRDTQQALLDVMDAPDEIERLVNRITKLWMNYYNQLDAIIRPSCGGTTPWAAIWSPKRCYMLQCDFCYMISPAMFERFVLPDLTASCEALDHGFYHLDGIGALPHVDMLLSIEKLRGIQWVPGDGQPTHRHWMDLLKKIIDAGKLCQIYVTADDARAICNEIGGKGFALFITDAMTSVQADELVKELTT